MERFYPKNFVLWRPHLLLLLIFLEAIYESAGMASDFPLMDGSYRAYCTTDNDCRQEFPCDKNRNECACPLYKNKHHAMFYDSKFDKCFSPVKKICTMEEDGLGKVECVPNAQCVPHNSKHIPSVFGLCECRPSFEMTEDHLCKPAMVLVVGNNKPIIVLDRKSGDDILPIEQDMQTATGSSLEPTHITTTDPKNGRMEHLISSSIDDPNSGIEVNRHILDRDLEFSSGEMKKSCLAVIIAFGIGHLVSYVIF